MEEMGRLLYKKKIYPVRGEFYLYFVPAAILCPILVAGVIAGIIMCNVLVFMFYLLWLCAVYISFLISRGIYRLSYLMIYEKGISVPVFHIAKKSNEKKTVYFREIVNIDINSVGNLEIITNEIANIDINSVGNVKIITKDKKIEVAFRDPSIDRKEIIEAAKKAYNDYIEKSQQ